MRRLGLLCAALVAACAQPPPGPPGDEVVVTPPPEVTAALTLALDPPSTQAISEVQRIVVRAEVMHAVGAQAFALELLAPTGTPYDKRTQPLAELPMALQAVELVFPVAGTLIEQAALSGVWTARATVAGVPVASTTFELDP
jgi:hypothetical protein